MIVNIPDWALFVMIGDFYLLLGIAIWGWRKYWTEKSKIQRYNGPYTTFRHSVGESGETYDIETLAEKRP